MKRTAKPPLVFGLSHVLVAMGGVIWIQHSAGFETLRPETLALLRTTVLGGLAVYLVARLRADLAVVLLATLGLWLVLGAGRLAPVVTDGICLLIWGAAVILPPDPLSNRNSETLTLWPLLAGSALALMSLSIQIGWFGPTGAALDWAIAGLLHHDTLMHAAIVQSLKTTGVVSTGLHGSPEIAYHVLSHRLVLGLSHWTGLEPLQAYGVMHLTVLQPLLWATLLMVWRVVTPASAAAITTGTPAIWVTPVAVVLFLGLQDWRSYMTSESYGVSLIILLLTVALLAQRRHQKLTGPAWITWGLVAVCVLAVSLAKISVGAVMACVVGMAALVSGRVPLWGRLPLALVVSVLPFVVVYLSAPVQSGTQAPLIGPFAYYARYSGQASYHILWTILVSWAAWRNWSYLGDSAWLGWALLTGVWAALTVSLLLNLEAGAQYYFGNPGVWLGLVLLGLLGWPNPLKSRWMRKTRLSLVAGMFVLGVANEDVLIRGPKTFWETRTTIRALAFQERPFASFWQKAQAASEVGTKALYVPAASPVWAERPYCWKVSLNLGALSSLPLIYGLPPEGCSLRNTYGFLAYDHSRARSGAHTDSELCRTAIMVGVPGPIQVMEASSTRPLSCQYDKR